MTAPVSVNGRRFYTYRGQQLESVTSLLNRGYPKMWLPYWSAKNVAQTAWADRSWLDMEEEAAVAYLKGSPWRKRDKAGDHGLIVHKALEALARGAKTFKAPITFTSHVAAVSKFWKAYRPTPVHVESQVYSLSHGYAGTFDLLAWVYGRLLLIDAKTSMQLGHDMRLQLSAYRFADFIGGDDKVLTPMPTVHAAAILWIPRDNPRAWQLIEVEAGRQEFTDFLKVKDSSDMLARYDGQAVGELILPQAEGVPA